jgi:hypothetical protein
LLLVLLPPTLLALALLLQSHLATGTALRQGTSSNLDQRNESRHVSSAELNSSTLSSMTGADSMKF